MGTKFFDQYSLLHFATGIIAYFFNVSFRMWFLFHTLFEIVENTEAGIILINRYFPFWPGGKPYPDAVINSIGDTVFSLLGWVVAYRLDKTGAELEWYQAHL